MFCILNIRAQKWFRCLFTKADIKRVFTYSLWCSNKVKYAASHHHLISVVPAVLNMHNIRSLFVQHYNTQKQITRAVSLSTGNHHIIPMHYTQMKLMKLPVKVNSRAAAQQNEVNELWLVLYHSQTRVTRTDQFAWLRVTSACFWEIITGGSAGIMNSIGCIRHGWTIWMIHLLLKHVSLPVSRHASWLSRACVIIN